jgi:competence protein ComEA
VAAARLDRLAQQWRPVSPSQPPPTGSPSAPADSWAALADAGARQDDDADRPSRIGLGPWNRSAVRGLTLVVCAAVAVAGWWWWTGRPREAVAAPMMLATGASVSGLPRDKANSSPTPSVTGTPSPAAVVVVHVVGQVRKPGVVTLPLGSRVGDAVDAVGGATKKGAEDSVNLARVLVDGEQVIVGFAAQAVAGVLGIAPSRPSDGLVNLNTGDAAAFDLLPGVGPVLAERIVQWRTANGPFRSIDELGEVSGIGDAILARLRPMVTV